MSNELRNFLTHSYDELEDLNLNAKEQRRTRVASHKIQEERLRYLTDEKRIKAVTVLFSDLEGRLHMLDYDKSFLSRVGTISPLTVLPSAALPRNAKVTFVWPWIGALFIGDLLIFLGPVRCWFLAM